MYTLASIPNVSQNSVTRSQEAVGLLPWARTAPSKELYYPTMSAPASERDHASKLFSRTDAKDTCSLRYS